MSGRKVLFVQATDAAAYPPLLHAGTIFAESGWRTTFLSAPRFGVEPSYPEEADFEILDAPIRPDHTWSKPAYARYCLQAMRVARKLRPDLVYVSDPIGALPGLIAARIAGARFIYHEHDSPNQAADLNPLVRVARRRAARKALRVVFPNAGRAERCAPDLRCEAGRVTVVWNVPRRNEAAASVAGAGERFVLHYQGGISPDRVPCAAAEALARFEGRATLRLAGCETPSATGYLRHLVERFGRVDRGGLIDHVGFVGREDMLRVATASDAGLMLVPSGSSDINFAHMTGASNKAFEYMAAGLPLIVSALPDWQEMFVTPGHALAVDPANPESIAQAVGKLIDNPRLRAEIGRRNRDRIVREWNYETCFVPVLQAVGGV
jgi:glycosyltransferase involved in cell wall biosynthesis